MLSDKEILKIANDTYNDFLMDFLIDCKFECVSLKKFFDLAKKSPQVSKYAEEKKTSGLKDLNIPAIVVHGDIDKIFFCNKIVNKVAKRLSKEKQKMFIRAIVLHELYHIVNRSDERELSYYSFMKSERRAHEEFKEDYPELFRVLEELKKKTKK